MMLEMAALPINFRVVFMGRPLAGAEIGAIAKHVATAFQAAPSEASAN